MRGTSNGKIRLDVRVLAVLAYHGDDIPLAGPDLLDVEGHLFIDVGRRRNANNRAVFINERDRPVLHFTGGITFRREYTKFL